MLSLTWIWSHLANCLAVMAGTVTKLGKLLPSKTAVFVCDIQERFRPIINGMPAVVDTARRLVSIGAPAPVAELLLHGA